MSDDIFKEAEESESEGSQHFGKLITATNPYFERAETCLDSAAKRNLSREEQEHQLLRAQTLATLAGAWEDRQARIYRDNVDEARRVMNQRAIERELDPKQWLLGSQKINPVTGKPYEDGAIR